MRAIFLAISADLGGFISSARILSQKNFASVFGDHFHPICAADFCTFAIPNLFPKKPKTIYLSISFRVPNCGCAKIDHFSVSLSEVRYFAFSYGVFPAEIRKNFRKRDSLFYFCTITLLASFFR